MHSRVESGLSTAEEHMLDPAYGSNGKSIVQIYLREQTHAKVR